MNEEIGDTIRIALMPRPRREHDARRDGCVGNEPREHFTTLKGTYDELATAFRALVDDYVATKYPKRESPKPVSV